MVSENSLSEKFLPTYIQNAVGSVPRRAAFGNLKVIEQLAYFARVSTARNSGSLR